MRINKLLYILPLAVLVSCDPEFDEVEFNGGSADFSKSVALGNSLTAGFQSNALSADGQMNSLPAMIAGQLKLVGGGEFKQPMLTGEVGEKGAGINNQLIQLGLLLPELSLVSSTNCIGETSVAPDFIPGGTTQGVPNAVYPVGDFTANISANGPFNNVGVPGARIGNLNLPGYGSAQGNPYFARFAANPLETMLAAAMKVDATFFELWIGNNDVLGYATSGGDEGGDAVTDPAVFNTLFNAAVDSLTKNGAKGVVANIPYVTSIPYFTTVPIGTDAITQAQADQLNSLQAYGGYNLGLDQAVAGMVITQAEADRRKINFTAGQVNTFVVIDPTLTTLTGLNPALINIRQIAAGELLTLTTPGDSLLCGGWGTAKPIPGNFHLTAAEISSITSAVDSYNSTIKNAAGANGLAFVDANARLQELATKGITIDGITFNSSFVTGGAFSLDGVHPNTSGYAIIANDFIDAINSTYGANVPKVDVAAFPAIEVEQ